MNDSIVMVGAGGHAKVCIELFRAAGQEVAYCIGGPNETGECLGVPIIQGDEQIQQLRQKGFAKLFVAIGSNSVREKLAARAIDAGYEIVNAISPVAQVSPSAVMGRGIAVMAGAVINAATEVEDFAIINTGATIDHDCRISSGVHIAPQCGLAGNVMIGAKTFLGIGCRVIPEKAIGESSVVGAGSVVINDLPSHITAVGVPAKVIRSHNQAAA
ncbi:acetyltransferase [Stratiformator vulcanicus]|uniref:Acetyltransferase EpsM n=1 Tax=Stratiformator vulcanicus TaxID=2527980 RepID=A0A517QWD6_9PLAN|nr:acetyltransferase [Stratiformator vulcanicus]QDT35985.1 Putative acetyltransferase EpsM [Stratiformator vulcanicus]